MKIIYKSIDGKDFDSKENCLSHEKSLGKSPVMFRIYFLPNAIEYYIHDSYDDYYAITDAPTVKDIENIIQENLGECSLSIKDIKLSDNTVYYVYKDKDGPVNVITEEFAKDQLKDVAKDLSISISKQKSKYDEIMKCINNTDDIINTSYSAIDTSNILFKYIGTLYNESGKPASPCDNCPNKGDPFCFCTLGGNHITC